VGGRLADDLARSGSKYWACGESGGMSCLILRLLRSRSPTRWSATPATSHALRAESKAMSPAPHCLCLRHGVPACRRCFCQRHGVPVCRRCFCRGCGSHSDLRYLLPKAYKSAGKAFTAGQGDAQISP
jgi:hypothetical protein